jgi:serine/threonine protein kinase
MSLPTTFDAPSPETLGSLLPAYDFELLIAVGGMGAVYKARQRSLDRDVAIKILPREMSGDPAFRDSFQTEARAMARLNHPNLIGVYDSGTVDGMLYIAMEYVAGKPLYYSSYGIQIDPEQAVQLVDGICAGLGHAHENGIIHRDIKPANILLTPRAEPKIGDFGLARPTDSDGPGLAMGTPGYTAPEVLRHPAGADRRSDLYAVGVILYELLTGKPQEGDAPPPSSLAGVDARMDAIWRRATDPDPEKRFPDAAAFQAALKEWRDGPAKGAVAGRPSPLLTGSPKRPALAVPSAAGAVGSVAAAVPPPPQTNWALARNLLIIAGLLVTTVIVWSYLDTARNQRHEENEKIARAGLAPAGGVPLAREPATPPPAERGQGDLQPVRNEESPRDSLERLRSRLASGDRREMPAGSRRDGDRHFLFIEEPMGWHDAAEFAAKHGGHLALPASPDDLDKIAQRATAARPVWIAAGRSGGDAWSLANGTAWTPPAAPAGSGNHVAIDRDGLPRAADASERLPFYIEWQGDGSNPALIATALAATAETLAEGEPVYPPGTVSFESRHFLYVPQVLDWRAASVIAQQAGGHLAVPASEGEGKFLEQFVAAINPRDRIWIGGRREGAQWAWITGEPWETARWSADASDDGEQAALVIRPGDGWAAADPSSPADGFIIEWSTDSGEVEDPADSPAGSADQEIAALTVRAGELLKAADIRRTEQLKTNVRDLGWALDAWIRGLPRNEQANWQGPVDQIKDLISVGRVLPEAPKRIPLSPKMEEAVNLHAQRQKQLDDAFIQEAEKLRVAYAAKVTEAIAEAGSKGQKTLEASLRTTLAGAAEVLEWVKSFGIDPLPANPNEPEPEPEPERNRGFDRDRGFDRERMREIEREIERRRREGRPFR